jgi:hypothetical protein
MKKIFVVALFLILCSAPISVMAEHSAVDRGSFEFGIGNIASVWLYGGANYENATWIGFGSTPDLTAGYFVINGLMVGTTFYFDWFKSESMTESDNNFFIQPIVKYYLPISDKFLVNAKVFFGWARSKSDGDPDSYTRARFGGGVAGTYMLLPELGACIGADIIIFPDRKVSGTTIANTSFNVIDIAIGLSAYL